MGITEAQPEEHPVVACLVESFEAGQEQFAGPVQRIVLAVHAAYDPGWYATGVKITDTDMDALPLTRHDWHPDWNYTIAQTNPR